jgi:hypothetical protein
LTPKLVTDLRKPPVILKTVPKASHTLRKSTNEREGKPDQNFDAAFRICRKNRENAPKEIFTFNNA